MSTGLLTRLVEAWDLAEPFHTITMIYRKRQKYLLSYTVLKRLRFETPFRGR